MISLHPDEWRRVRSLFERAVDVPAGERMQFVAEACLGDEAFHGRVATLVAAHERARDFLETGCVATIAGWLEEDLSGAQFGPYRLESRVGGGGMGEVYRARDTRLGRTVAIKVLPAARLPLTSPPASVSSARRASSPASITRTSARSMTSALRGPTQRLGAYLVMELLDGETLADRLAKGAAAAPAKRSTARYRSPTALDTAHRAGIVHRDLKPGTSC